MTGFPPGLPRIHLFFGSILILKKTPEISQKLI